MCRIATVWTLALGSVLALTAMVRADVVIRGPFGRQIVVPSPNDVHIGPRNVMVNPTTTAPPGLLPGETIEPPLAVGPAPTAFAPVVAAPQPPNLTAGLPLPKVQLPKVQVPPLPHVSVPTVPGVSVPDPHKLVGSLTHGG